MNPLMSYSVKLPSLYRANIKFSNEFDEKLDSQEFSTQLVDNLQGVLTRITGELKIVDLFAGAGGMGLGFLSAGNKKNGYKLISAAEIDPIYLCSLQKNYNYFSKHSKKAFDECCPKNFEPMDLRRSIDRQKIVDIVNNFGGVDILIGGSPCQGFSQSNRSSWSPDNPYNQLVDSFVSCAVELKPKVVLMENVQGILWTPRKGNAYKNEITVVEHISKKLVKAGYILFPKVLDAAWYGVPQHRNRFFLLALHNSLGYKSEDFGDWGAFPKPTHGYLGKQPYVTVAQAISDLPIVENGENRLFQDYLEPSNDQLRQNKFLQKMRHISGSGGMIEGHIVSKQADYVIERYKNIPEGGNWKDIQHMLTNYTDVRNTHSNIYRRLKSSEPSITIGNYRKSMIVHPLQNRGLSLREATRLQSLPDWFTFSNSTDASRQGGLTHKQQQLANAVSFLLTEAIAKHILKF
jgi:DNA (cytosine-5)-methyltransferase 1